MKKITFKKGSVGGTALRSVTAVAITGSLLFGGYSFYEQHEELNKAKEIIVQNESSLKHQVRVINDLELNVKNLEQDKMDLKSKNDNLLKDNATLNRKLEDEIKNVSNLKQKLKQTELQARKK